jgi:FlaA1/EpsC-like NDP-sugar epimerase
MILIKQPKTALVLLHDIAVAAIAWLGAYLLRFNFDIPTKFWPSFWQTLLLVVPLQALVFWRFGLYRGIWRFASLPDLKRIVSAVLVSILLFTSILFLLRMSVVVPRSVLVLDPILLLLIMGGSRLIYRAWKEYRLYGAIGEEGEPVLVLGGGEIVVSLLKELQRNPQWHVVGLLDSHVQRHGRDIYGVKVLGGIDQLPEIADRLNVKQVIMAMPSESHESRRKAMAVVEQAGLRVLTVPSIDDIASGRVSISKVRPVEVEDLLGRDPVELNEGALQALIENQVVMVTGAGGSIGSELCRQIARFQPQLLVLFELNEYALYQLEQEMLQYQPHLKCVCVIGDVRNMQRVKDVLQRYHPRLVFHAAAYKHVPLMEWGNVTEALANNVLGTYVLATACKQVGVQKFVLVSTDKAVNPTNVMGASKRLAEMVCQGLQEVEGTRFVMVRFGNVLGSSGSVIPKFRQQIEKGGPLTVTHAEVTRYFMSIPEATQLVLQAGLMGQGGEIFVLDMGEPVKIVELAREMIRLSGFSEGDIKIVFTGLRPGEKLYEELLADDEYTLSTPHPKLRIAQARRSDAAWVEVLVRWVSECQGKDESAIKEELQGWLEEYRGEVDAKAASDVPHSTSASSIQ